MNFQQLPHGRGSQLTVSNESGRAVEEADSRHFSPESGGEDSPEASQTYRRIRRRRSSGRAGGDDYNAARLQRFDGCEN
jgi:hypothetical protein